MVVTTLQFIGSCFVEVKSQVHDVGSGQLIGVLESITEVFVGEV